MAAFMTEISAILATDLTLGLTTFTVGGLALGSALLAAGVVFAKRLGLRR